MRWPFAATMALAFCAGGQTSPESATLDRIKTKVAQNLAALPNYTCTLTVRRSRQDPRTGKLEARDNVRLEVAMIEGKEQFGWPGDKRIDEPEVMSLVKTGAIGSGAFGLMTQNVFLSPAIGFAPEGEEEKAGRQSLKYSYTVPAGSSGYHLHFGEREAVVPYHGAFWVDRDTLDLIEMEFEAGDIPPSLRKAAARGRIEYRRVLVSGAARLLPTVAELILKDPDGLESRNVTQFHNCRQYTSRSLFSLTEPPPAPAASPEPKVAETSVPDQMALELSLETGIKGSSAVGDPLRLTVKEPVKQKRQILVPKGAVVTGRIQRLEQRTGFFILQIGLESLEWDSGRATLSGRRNLISMNLPAQISYGGPGRTRPVSGTFGDPDAPETLIVPSPHISLLKGTPITLRSTVVK
jgi:hypothetical protein